jgi:hypothetical protein
MGSCYCAGIFGPMNHSEDCSTRLEAERAELDRLRAENAECARIVSDVSRQLGEARAENERLRQYFAAAEKVSRQDWAEAVGARIERDLCREALKWLLDAATDDDDADFDSACRHARALLQEVDRG